MHFKINNSNDCKFSNSTDNYINEPCLANVELGEELKIKLSLFYLYI